MGGPPSMNDRSKMNEDTFAPQDTVSWKIPRDEFVSFVVGEKQTVLSRVGDGFTDACGYWLNLIVGFLKCEDETKYCW